MLCIVSRVTYTLHNLWVERLRDFYLGRSEKIVWKLYWRNSILSFNLFLQFCAIETRKTSLWILRISSSVIFSTSLLVMSLRLFWKYFYTPKTPPNQTKFRMTPGIHFHSCLLSFQFLVVQQFDCRNEYKQLIVYVLF